jgi:hypothetical protein
VTIFRLPNDLEVHEARAQGRMKMSTIADLVASPTSITARVQRTKASLKCPQDTLGQAYVRESYESLAVEDLLA